MAKYCEVCAKEGSDSSSLLRCSKCKDVWYCGAECQKADWKTHKHICHLKKGMREARENAENARIKTARMMAEAPDSILGVNLLGGYNSPFNAEPTMLPKDHPVFSDVRLSRRTSPISKVIGIPVAFWRHRTDDPMDHLTSDIRASLDNQSVTYMMVDPYTGWASAEWQQGIGPVTVARLDKKPLTIGALELIWMFCDHCMEIANEVGEEAVREEYEPGIFLQWCKEYLDHSPRNDVTLPLT